MHTLEYFNHDSEENIAVKLDEHRRSTYIYGGNGMGKTTLSRALAKEDPDNSLVFNQDFINQNVFVVTSSGTKTDTDTKDGLSDLFLGKEAVDLATTSERLKIRLRESDKLYQEMISERISALSEYELTPKELLDKFENLTYHKDENEKFTFEEDYNYDNQNKMIIIEELLPTEVTEKTYENNYESFKNNRLFKELQELLNQEEVKYMMSHEGKPNIDITEYNRNLEAIKISEKMFERDAVSVADYKEWIRFGVYLHEEQENCLFCDSKDITEVVARWKKQIESTTARLKNQVIGQLNQNISALNEIIKLREPLKDLVPKTIATVDNLEISLKDYKDQVTKNKELEFKCIEISNDKSMVYYGELQEMLINYELNKNLHQNITLIEYRDALETEFKRIQQFAVDKTNAEAKDIQERLKNNLKKLGFNKDIIIKSDTRGNRPKIDLLAKDGAIGNFSEGQQHKVALALFFAKIEISKESGKTLNYIVFDDPMRSLDVDAYHRLQRMISDINRRVISERLIVLTHNMHYLYVQTAYALENQKQYDKVQLFEMRPDSVTEVELSHLRKDDIVLYTMMLRQATELEDIGRIYWMTSKIVRSFLDLKMRMSGKFEFSQKPSEDIRYLCDIHGFDYKALNSRFQKITRVCRKKTVNVEEVSAMFRAANEFLNALEFVAIIPASVFNFLEEIDQEVEVQVKEGTGILADILLRAYKVSTYNEEDDYRKSMANYINHPRNQITSSLFFLNSVRDNTDV